MKSTLQPVFHAVEGYLREDGVFVDVLVLRVLGGKLPKGMFAQIEIQTHPDGHQSAGTVIQGRSKHGRRYDTFGSGAAAQAAVEQWAKRKLRERREEC